MDAQGSGLLSDTEKPEMRRRLYEVTNAAFEQARIRAPRLYQEDRGDGILSVLAADVPPRRVVGEWLEYLHQDLRQLNRGLRTPLRLRVGLHIGPVTADEHGRSGRAVDLACRLRGTATPRRRSSRPRKGHPWWRSPPTGCTRTSSSPHGRWVEPDRYRRHEVELKEGRKAAWFTVPGLPQPPDPATTATAPRPEPPQPQPQGTGDSFVQNNHHHGSGQFIANGKVDTLHIDQYGGER